MKNRMSVLAWLAACVVAFCACGAPAAEKSPTSQPDAWAASRLGRTRLGDVWMGPAITQDDLRGQVVLLEFWGYRCPPCIASIPHLAKLQAQGASRGLVVIGAHAQGATDAIKARALAIAKAKGANYTILSYARVPDAKFRAIPRVFVFDHRGEVVFEGLPNKKMDEAVVAAVKRRPHPLLGEMKYTAMAAAAQKVRAGRLGAAWTECKAKAGAEGAAGKEATFLLANLDRHAGRLAEQAETAQTESPAQCLALLTRLKREFAGAPPAAEADKKLKGLAKDKAFQTERKAERPYGIIARAAAQVPPCPTDAEAKAAWIRRYGAGARQIKARVEALKKQFPETRAAEKADKLLIDILGEG